MSIQSAGKAPARGMHTYDLSNNGGHEFGVVLANHPLEQSLRAIDLLRAGMGHPAFFSEELMEKWALMRGWSPTAT